MNLQKKRLAYQPPLPELLKELKAVAFQPCEGKKANESIRKLFPKTFERSPYKLVKGKGEARPLKIGAVFSGGPAAGGHNVLAGLFDALRKIHPESKLIGFLNGPSGIVENKTKELGEKEIAAYRNQGGFDLLGSGRTKIETEEQFEASAKACKELDGLIVIGGDDSNTNAALLAEFFLTKGIKTSVVGLPKTIDGDLQSDDIEVSFGFDSACKTYAELIGNIARDAQSAKKYYHFVKLMGRSASHIALECALKTQPNLVFIGEEKKSLHQIVREIVELIQKRKELRKDYGIVLIPEGLVEFIPEIKSLIQELQGKTEKDLSPDCRKTFSQLPEKIQKQLLLERDPHGNIPVSQIETQQLLMHLVKKEVKFTAQDHFFGYEGRCCFPSNFDANYCYALGYLAALAVRDQLTGVVGAIQNLHSPPSQWKFKAVPLVQMIHLEMRGKKEKPVIQKTLVDIKGKPFVHYSRIKKSWETEDQYCYPGPIQFFGDPEICNSVPLSLELSHGGSLVSSS